MKKLSIIIPVYNVERYLAKCLDSVLRPELDGYEIILVNDGSTDSSPEIAHSYEEKYPELIRLISTPNGGLGHARNTGLEAASGEYILFLDSDDCLEDKALPEIMQTLKQDFDICIFDLISVNDEGRRLSCLRGCARQGAFTLEEYPELLFAPPNACNKLWKRALFIENGIRFPDRMWFEDLCTVPRLYLQAKRIGYTPKPWYIYLQRSGSITNSANADRNLEMISASEMLLDFFRKAGRFEQFQPQLEYMLAYHELITSSTRVNLIDRNSAVQDRLLEHYTACFPGFMENPYIKNIGPKYRLLLRLIVGRHRAVLNGIMRLNNFIKKK